MIFEYDIQMSSLTSNDISAGESNQHISKKYVTFSNDPIVYYYDSEIIHQKVPYVDLSTNNNKYYNIKILILFLLPIIVMIICSIFLIFYFN